MLMVTMALLMAPQAMPMPNSARLPAHCKTGHLRASKPGARARGAQKLNELPPANVYYALYRRGPDGCPDPIVLRKGIGTQPVPRNDAVPVPRTNTPR